MKMVVLQIGDQEMDDVENKRPLIFVSDYINGLVEQFKTFTFRFEHSVRSVAFLFLLILHKEFFFGMSLENFY